MKTALITGGAKRIGKALARHLHNKNYFTIIHYNQSEEEAVKLHNELPNSRLIQSNFEDKESAVQLMSEIDTHIDLLINNASIFKNDNPKNYSPELSNKILQVNLITPIKLINEITKSQESCSIINILDAWALDNNENFLSYCQSKKSLAQFTIDSSKHLPTGFKINGISIGMALHKEGFPKDIFTKLSQKYPSSVEDICKAVDSILSDRTMNGKIIDITKNAN